MVISEQCFRKQAGEQETQRESVSKSEDRSGECAVCS